MTVRIKNWWNNLWIREDEFDESLDLDGTYLQKVGLFSDKGRKYLQDLVVRREVAHHREMKLSDEEHEAKNKRNEP